MTQSVHIEVRAGQPYARAARLVGGVALWPATPLGVEARGHVRREAGSEPLLFDLTPHLAVTRDGQDVVVALSLTGQHTRALPVRGAVYDVWLSDPGTTDARAVCLMAGRVVVTQAVTAP